MAMDSGRGPPSPLPSWKMRAGPAWPCVGRASLGIGRHGASRRRTATAVCPLSEGGVARRAAFHAVHRSDGSVHPAHPGPTPTPSLAQPDPPPPDRGWSQEPARGRNPDHPFLHLPRGGAGPTAHVTPPERSSFPPAFWGRDIRGMPGAFYARPKKCHFFAMPMFSSLCPPAGGGV